MKSDIRSFSLLAVAALLPISCVAPTNPLDADAPLSQQARASLFGEVRANVPLADTANYPAIEGATVTLTLADGGKLSETTDADGAFFHRDFVPGTVTIEVSHPDYQASVSDLPTFAPGEKRSDRLFLLTLHDASSGNLSTVTGVVQKDRLANHSGIVVRDEANPALFGVTQSDGSVRLQLSPGEHRLQVEEYGFEPTTVDVSVDASTPADFGVVTLPFIPGEVSGNVSVEDPAVAGAITVTLDRGGVDQVSADGTGDYVLPVVPLGSYRLEAIATGHDTESVAGIDVVPLEVTDVAPIFLRRSRGRISGVAVYPPGFDDDNSNILVSVAGTSSSGVTDVDGNFFIEGVPTNEVAGYSLSFRAEDFLPRVVPGVTVSKNETTLLADTVVLAKQIGDFAITPSPYSATTDVTLQLAPIPAGAVELRISESPDLGAVPYIAFPVDGDGQIDPNVPYSIVGGDGQVTLYVQYRLNDATEVGPFSSSVVLDRVAPEVAPPVLGNGSGVTNEDGVVVSVSATDVTSAPATYEVSEDETFSGLAPIVTEDIAFPSLVDFVPPAVDGPRTLYVRVTDLAGNVSAPVSSTIVRDTTAPTLTAFSMDCQGVIDAAVCSDSSVSLTITSPDAANWFVSTLENPPVSEADWNSFQAPLVFAGLGQAPGTRTLYLYLRDLAGNVSASFSDTITIDTDAPNAASVLIDSGAAFVPGGRTSVALTLFALGASTMRISADPDTSDDVAVAYAPSSTLTLPVGIVDGPFTVYVTFRDDAGNEVTVSDSITFDSTAPVPGPTAIAINQGAAFSASLSVTLSLDAADATEMQLTTRDIAAGSTSTTDWLPFAVTTLALLPSGDCLAAAGACKEVCVRFRDAATNETDGLDCAAVALDSSAPAVPIVTTDLGFTSSRDVALALSEQPADENFLRYEILITPGQNDYTELVPTTTTPPAFDLTLPNVAVVASPIHRTKQEFLIRLRAVDAAGNAGAEIPLQVVYDEWDPPAPAVSGAPTVVNADTHALLFTAGNEAQNDATFANYEVGQVSCDGVPTGPAACEGQTDPPTWTASAQTDGLLFSLIQGQDNGCVSPCVNKLFVRAVDGAGNISPASSVVVKEDSVAPTKPKIAPKTATVPGIVAPMRITQASTDSSGVTYEIRGGTSDNFVDLPSGAAGVAVFDLLRDEDNELCIRAKDAAGNVGTEDCAVINQVSSNKMVTAQEVAFTRISGDFIGFITNRSTLFVQDLRRGNEVNVIQDWHDGSFDSDAKHVDLDVFDQTLYAPHVVFGEYGVPPNDGFKAWVAVAAIPIYRDSFDPPTPCLEPIEGAPLAGCDTPWMSIAFDDGLGNFETRYNVDSNTRVAVNGGYFAAIVRDNNDNYVIETLPVAGQLDANQVVRVGAMDPGGVICEGTSPHIGRRPLPDAPVVTWCQDVGGVATVWRADADTANSAERIGLSELETGDTFEEARSFHQPVANASTIYWVEGGDLRQLPHASAPNTDTAVDSAHFTDRIYRLHDVTDERLAFVGFADNTQAGSGNFFLYEIGAQTEEQLTDGLLAPYEAVVDGTRVMWNDRSQDESAVFRDLEEISWVSHNPSLIANAKTDGTYTTWIDTRDGNLHYYGFDHDTREEFLLTDDTSFASVTEGGDKQANGFRAFVRDVGAESRLVTRDLPNNIECLVPTTGGANALAQIQSYSLEEANAAVLAFSQNGQIWLTTRGAGCSWSAPVSIVDASATPNQTKDIAVSLDNLGNPVLSWEEEIPVENRREHNCFATSVGTAMQTNNTDEFDLPGGPVSTFFIEPTLANVDGAVYWAARFFDFSEEGTEKEHGVAYCELACDGTNFCVAGAPPTRAFGTGVGGELDRPQLSSEGFLVASEVSQAFATSSHLTIIDINNGARRSTPPAFLNYDISSDASIAPGRASYSSTALGSTDVWTTTIRR